MLNIEIITHGYETEKEYLKNNHERLTDRISSFDPKYNSILQVVMRNGQIREYHGALAVKIFKHLTRKGDNI